MKHVKHLFGDPAEWDWQELRYRAKGAAAVTLCFVIILGAGIYGYTKAMKTWHEFQIREDYIGDGTGEVSIVIPRGSNTYQISDILATQDVIRTPKAFDTLALNDPRSATIQPGHYKLKKQIPAATALDMLLDPKNRLFRRVTIVEGLTLDEIKWHLAQPTDKGGIGVSLDDVNAVLADPDSMKLSAYATNPVGTDKKEEPWKRAEGFLFPDTYEFGEDGTALEALQVMSARFKQVSAEMNLEQGAKARNRSPRDIVIIASIVEREVKRPEDRARVAQVLYNRLDKDMPLGLDSTVHYAVNKPAHEKLTRADFANPSPYNTYYWTGLPAGPISNPGRASLEAAMNPAAGEWLYFTTINLDTGETNFELTQEEHAASEALYQEWCAKNPNKCEH